MQLLGKEWISLEWAIIFFPATALIFDNRLQLRVTDQMQHHLIMTAYDSLFVLINFFMLLGMVVELTMFRRWRLGMSSCGFLLRVALSDSSQLLKQISRMAMKKMIFNQNIFLIIFVTEKWYRLWINPWGYTGFSSIDQNITAVKINWTKHFLPANTVRYQIYDAGDVY